MVPLARRVLWPSPVPHPQDRCRNDSHHRARVLSRNTGFLRTELSPTDGTTRPRIRRNQLGAETSAGATASPEPEVEEGGTCPLSLPRRLRGRVSCPRRGSLHRPPSSSGLWGWNESRPRLPWAELARVTLLRLLSLPCCVQRTTRGASTG